MGKRTTFHVKSRFHQLSLARFDSLMISSSLAILIDPHRDATKYARMALCGPFSFQQAVRIMIDSGDLSDIKTTDRANSLQAPSRSSS